MAYYFMIEPKKGKYQELNISNSKYFQNNQRKYKKPCAYTLEEIDNFTIMFNNEEELREELYKEGIINQETINKPLSIRYSMKEQYTKVPYDLLYQNSIEYLINPEKLIETILKRYYQDDYMLIKKIATTFSNFRRCSSTAPEVRQYIEDTIRTGTKSKNLDLLDENGDKIISRLLKLIILESYDDYYTGKVIYKNKINYRNFHVLIALINYYDKENTKSTKLETAIKEQPLTKKLGKKKYELENQLKFEV